MNWTRYGPNAWMLRFADRVGDEAFAKGEAILSELERSLPPGLVEIVPAFTTVLLEFQPGAVTEANAILESLSIRLENAAPVPARDSPVQEIPVVYDGPDLDRVAALHELTTAEVCSLHSEPIYRVYLIGFAPGFPYLGELNPRLHTPRLRSPRPRVAAGSVAIGGEHTGIYSIESPGGWNIIGHTPFRLVAPEHSEGAGMFALRRGDRVKFSPRRRG